MAKQYTMNEYAQARCKYLADRVNTPLEVFEEIARKHAAQLYDDDNTKHLTATEIKDREHLRGWFSVPNLDTEQSPSTSTTTQTASYMQPQLPVGIANTVSANTHFGAPVAQMSAPQAAQNAETEHDTLGKDLIKGDVTVNEATHEQSDIQQHADSAVHTPAVVTEQQIPSTASPEDIPYVPVDWNSPTMNPETPNLQAILDEEPVSPFPGQLLSHTDDVVTQQLTPANDDHLEADRPTSSAVSALIATRALSMLPEELVANDTTQGSFQATDMARVDSAQSHEEIAKQSTIPETPMIKTEPRDTTPDSGSSKITAAEGVAALTNHGIQVPVKARTYKKRSASEAGLEDKNDIDIAEGEDINQPEDKTLVYASVVPSTTGDIKQTPNKHAALATPIKQEPLSATKSKANTSEKRRRVATKVPREQSTAQPTPDQLRKEELADVVSGDALPLTKEEATDAAAYRYALLREHTPAQKGKGKKRKSIAPDMMPEFFEQKKLGKDSVRCVCGLITDDGTAMVQCEKCKVWQHNTCMIDGLPKDLKKGKYSCHVCDPWAHRVVIQRLRQESDI